MTYTQREIVLWLRDVVIMACVAALLHHFVFGISAVNGASMETSLHDQQYLLMDKTPFKSLNHGDIVVFQPLTETDRYYIKRIIGVAGDTIGFSNTNVYRNGSLLEEPYANCKKTESSNVQANTGECTYTALSGKTFTVPENSYFVMGDNREHSTDSRMCFGALPCIGDTPGRFIAKETIMGKPWFALWPPSSIGKLSAE